MLEGEPEVDEVISDPVVRRVMEADGVSEQELRDLIEFVRTHFDQGTPVKPNGK